MAEKRFQIFSSWLPKCGKFLQAPSGFSCSSASSLTLISQLNRAERYWNEAMFHDLLTTEVLLPLLHEVFGTMDDLLRDLIVETACSLAHLIVLSFLPLVYARVGGLSQFELVRSVHIER